MNPPQVRKSCQAVFTRLCSALRNFVGGFSPDIQSRQNLHGLIVDVHGVQHSPLRTLSIKLLAFCIAVCLVVAVLLWVKPPLWSPSMPDASIPEQCQMPARDIPDVCAHNHTTHPWKDLKAITPWCANQWRKWLHGELAPKNDMYMLCGHHASSSMRVCTTPGNARLTALPSFMANMDIKTLPTSKRLAIREYSECQKGHVSVTRYSPVMLDYTDEHNTRQTVTLEGQDAYFAQHAVEATRSVQGGLVSSLGALFS